MKPNIALSLSFEGISLLCRVQGGWHRLGEVSLASDDLGAELEALRGLAEQAEGPEFRSKLILPNDQVRYLLIDSGRGSRSKREAAAARALEEQTPYSIDELAFDVVGNGRQTHVAAVARETLAEAEAFAVEHHFNPVSFVAIPPESGYPNEPTFGLTEAASALLAGVPVDADDDVIVVVGSGPLEIKPAPEPEPTPEPAPEPEPEPQAQPEPAPEPLPEPQPEPEPKKEAAPEPAPEPASELAAKGEIAPERAPEPAPQTDPAPKATEPAKDAPPATGFSSIRARREETDTPKASPTLGGAARSVEGTNAPSLPPAGDSSPHTEAPLRFDPASVIAGLKASPVQDSEEEDAPAADAPAKSSFFSRRRDRAATPPPEADAPADDQNTDKEPSAALSAPTKTAATKEVPAPSERRNMTLFGARDGEVGGKPRHLGLVLTIVLLLFLAGVAIWATLFVEDGLAGLLRRDPVPQIAELEVESTPVEALAVEVDPVETNALAPVGTDSLTDSAEIEAMEGEGLVQDQMIDSAAIEAETDIIHPTALTEHEAEARYAVTGIWERAPLQPDTPPAGSTDSFYLTSIDRMLGIRDAIALPATENLAQDFPIAEQGSPLPFGTTFDLNEQGLVRATAQGALNPGGVMVYLGRPAVLPDSFPERTSAPGEGLTPQQVFRLSKFRPKARPDDLIEQNERASYGGRTLTELAVARPRLRPETLKAEEEKDTTPTAAAILASARPRARPANIAQLAARATPADPVVATPVAATVTPTIPSSASVARQATIQNAINLNKINLIGVYGTTASRRALVRLTNGRYKKVQVGDRIDGGKVAAISDTELRYVKSGKNVILKLPKG